MMKLIEQKMVKVVMYRMNNENFDKNFILSSTGINMAQNLLDSLSRLLAHEFAHSKNHDKHWHEFCQEYLDQNGTKLAKEGWQDNWHTICNDTRTNCDDELFYIF